MIDITGFEANDLTIQNTQVPKATNVLSVQLGALEYAPDLGIDLDYFLSEEFQIENDAFKAYLIQVLATNGINVTLLTETVETLYSKYSFGISPEESSTALVAR